MANIDVDTVKIRECGNDILKLVSDLNDNIEELYDRIAKMPTKTFEWVGDSANEFVAIVNVEKTVYVEMKNTLQKYGKYLLDTADILEQTTNKNKV